MKYSQKEIAEHEQKRTWLLLGYVDPPTTSDNSVYSQGASYKKKNNCFLMS